MMMEGVNEEMSSQIEEQPIEPVDNDSPRSFNVAEGTDEYSYAQYTKYILVRLAVIGLVLLISFIIPNVNILL